MLNILKLQDIHYDLPFLPKRMKIDKCKKLVCNLLNKNKYVVHIKSLTQASNHGLKLKKVHRIIKFNQKAWLKPYIDMNTELRKLAKDDFEKDLFKLMNNAAVLQIRHFQLVGQKELGVWGANFRFFEGLKC